MKKLCFYFLGVLIGLGSSFQLSAQDNPVIFTVANNTVKEKEFKYIYEKNNSGDPDLYSESSVRDYLDLYINFKLKVKAARDAGLDTTEKYLSEYKDYREQLAEPYLKDTTKLDELVKEAYQRMQEERNANHILIKVPEGAPPEDTTEAYKRAMDVYRQVKNGEKTFEEAARTYSEDEHTKSKGGELGYFSVFDMVYPFENVAFRMKEGEISEPFRTQYGYHILKMNDKRPYRGHVKTAHIMIQADQSEKKEWKNANKQIDSVYKALKNGADFEKMVQKYSDDRRSKQNSGRMPEFGSLTRRLPKKFRDEAFGLKEDGAFTEPFQTQYGWHILKRIDKRGVGDFEKERQQIKEQLKESGRHELVRKTSVKRLQKENGHRVYDQNLKAFKKQVDSNLLNGKWDPDLEDMEEKPLYEIGDTTFSTRAFAKYLVQNQKSNQYQFLDHAIKEYFRDFESKKTMAYERAHLEEKYPQFRNLITEYKEGILLFEITDEKVWSKAIKDSAGLKDFYKSHKTSYRQPKRKEATVITCNGKKVPEKIYKELLESDQSASEWYDKADPDTKGDCKIKEGTFAEKEHKVIKKAKEEPGVYKVKTRKKHHLIEVESTIPEGIPDLSEIRGKVIADYQNQLEEEWIQELKDQYQVKVNEEAVESLIRE